MIYKKQEGTVSADALLQVASCVGGQGRGGPWTWHLERCNISPNSITGTAPHCRNMGRCRHATAMPHITTAVLPTRLLILV